MHSDGDLFQRAVKVVTLRRSAMVVISNTTVEIKIAKVAI